ncbi:beta-mannosidase [Halyomorpha halys]|uniref:beta-mannosidase n=1 Tax=Halyomorpha halys TaxID=286706 RepID=UPI0006D4DE17|nr:beta-mannosidase [Halyomorpha halys]
MSNSLEMFDFSYKFDYNEIISNQQYKVRERDKRVHKEIFSWHLPFYSAASRGVMKTYCVFFFVIFAVNGLKVLHLSSQSWHLYNSNRTIDMITTIPGGVYSSLEDASMIDDILFANNDVAYRWVAKENWNYFTKFNISEGDLKNYSSIRLLLHGVDTIADVFVNDHLLIRCNNMFVRYSASVKSLLSVGTNNITILFSSPIREARKLAAKVGYKIPQTCPPSVYNGECHVNMLRKMQASFAWDWGPAFPSMGLWKNVEIVMSKGPRIDSVVVRTIPEDKTWKLNLTVGFGPSDVDINDQLTVEFYWSGKDKSTFTFPLQIKKVNKQKKDISFTLPKENITLWWPNGYGAQPLYKLRVFYSSSEKTINIGFRTISLVQTNVTKNKSDGTLFYFLINGLKIFAKGSNWIPSHVLPERLSDPKRVVPLLEASAAAHFNMIRIWGGGVYESDMFYETCDRLGIMIWQDLMFACSMYPVTDDFLSTVKIEVEQQIERLQHHPSVAVWAGNNENEAALMQNWYGTSSNFSLYKSDYLKLYVETIKPIVESIDDTRRYLVSSPSNDLEDISDNPSDTLNGDVHYYNYINDGWNYLIYPKPRFASEYGIQSLPSYHCLRAALPMNQTYWDSYFYEHRQHAPAGNANIYYQIMLNLPIAKKITDIIYLSQINQAMSMKAESERYRRLKSILLDSNEGYTMGALYWQIDDIWQAPSWSSIDYCGQWKMLHYYAKDFFAPVIVSPEISVDRETMSIYIVVDGYAPKKSANLTFNMYNWTNINWSPFQKITLQVNLIDNESFLVTKIPVGKYCKDKKCFYTTTLEVEGGIQIAPENFFFYTPLNSANYSDTSVKITKIEKLDDHNAKLSLKAEDYALFVWLDLNGIKGTFSKNGFHMLSPTTEVVFHSIESLDNISLNEITVTWLKRTYYDLSYPEIVWNI